MCGGGGRGEREIKVLVRLLERKTQRIVNIKFQMKRIELIDR